MRSRQLSSIRAATLALSASLLPSTGDCWIQNEQNKPSSDSTKARFSVTSDRSTFFVGEVLTLYINIAIDETFVQTRMVQPFRRRLDLPLRIDASWLKDLPGSTALPKGMELPTPKGKKLSLVVNGQKSSAELMRRETNAQGKPQLFAQVRRYFVLAKAGEMTIASAHMHFSHASEFKQGFLRERIPVSARAETRQSSPLTLRIRALPTEKRPNDFSGAIGQIQMSASVTPLSLDLGQNQKLTLTVSGKSPLSRFTPPSLGNLPDVHVVGRIEKRSLRQVILTYELRPLVDSLKKVPSIRLSYFDPARQQFAFAATRPIPIEVRPSPEGKHRLPGAKPRPKRHETMAPKRANAPPTSRKPKKAIDIADLKEPSVEGPLPSKPASTFFLIAALLASWAVGIGFWLKWRPHVANLEALRRARADAAAKVFGEALSVSTPCLATALTEYLSARLDAPAPSLVGVDVSQQLMNAGINQDIATQCDRVLDALHARRFGSDEPEQDRTEVQTIVNQLERDFRQAERATC